MTTRVDRVLAAAVRAAAACRVPIMCLVIATVYASPLAAQAPPEPVPRWFRGNTHTHTTNSDGNMPPEFVVRWYRDHGYDFVVITDHEHVTDVAPLNATFGVPGRFLVIPGEEITQQVADPAHADRRRQAHIVAIGLTKVIMPFGERRVVQGMTIAETYDRHIAAVKAAGAIPQVNHPNFRWSVVPDDMSGLPDSTLFEVWNGHPKVNNLGGGDGSGAVALSTEALWDTLLTRGKLLFGVASDDSHAFKPEDFEDIHATRPGLAWVMVRADSLTRAAIMAGLRGGHFYSTTGLTLADYHADAREVRLQFSPPTGPGDHRRIRTRFIGRGGRVLAEAWGPAARYTIRGDEGYVRATAVDSNGRQLWTQPQWVRSR